MKVAQKPQKGSIVYVEIDTAYTEGNVIRNTRPCIVWRHMTSPPCSMIIPLTTNLESTRYPYTLEIKKGPGNSLKQDSVALVFQLRVIDNEKLRQPVGNISAKEKRQINDFLVQYLDLVVDEKK
nr:type II toxin-antitoxin system PemK/MazF family toxin [Candidatus Sigynarchaeota archaeon]